MKGPLITPIEPICETGLSLSEAAHRYQVSVEWIVERVEAGYLPLEGVANPGAHPPDTWRFTPSTLTRLARLVWLEQTFDANAELAAFVADLLERK
ncbi:MAG: hypothetical protein WHS85_03135 [Hydrogenophilus sp.]